jgi:hypothetical protein
MLRKDTQLKSLEIRKQLLILESELNRTELLREVNHFKDEMARLKKQVATVGSIASSVAVLATTISFFRRRSAKGEKSSGSTIPWITAAIEGARIGSSLFSKIKSLFRERERE